MPELHISELVPADFPYQLHEIPQPPERLWMLGQWPPEGTKLLAVVGSRALTAYGREACRTLIQGLAGYPVSIVSGLALGADACAHQAALDAGLHTIAIPGSGLGRNAIYPRANVRLAENMLAGGGLLLSEHPPDYRAYDYDFPSRNRLVVGLSHAVLMIEAGERSGTLITARLAADYNRDLLCVPHRIGDPHAFGSHLFLRLGATLVSGSAHILEALGLTPREFERSAPPISLSASEQILYDLLSEPMGRDSLIRVSGMPVSECVSGLGMLELKGCAKESFGYWHRA